MAKLTDRQRKKIIAEYVNADGKISQQQLAEKYGVSRQAISKILNTTEGCERLQQKKEENTLSMLEFMEQQKDQAQTLMQKILSCAEVDIEKASLRDKMGAFKILSEAFGGNSTDENKQKDTINVVFSVTDVGIGANDDTDKPDNS